jgi:DNA-binding CsgD family transcriptional regulator
MPSTMPWSEMASAIGAVGTADHVDRLIDLIGALVPHDLVTVTRYSASRKPEFIKHRQFSDAMVRHYLDRYYVYDPFYAYWRRRGRVGVVPLKHLADAEVKRGKYIAEFLAQSRICDELGVMLEDGGDWCLGIFLDRSERQFRENEVELLCQAFPIVAALHALDIKTRQPGFMRTDTGGLAAASPQQEPTLPADLWPELSARERQLVQLILCGHPTATIARQLHIAVGTVKNHRLRIYEKLDITTERELFLEFFRHRSLGEERGGRS